MIAFDWQGLGLALLAFVAMEAVATLTHRYVMHGPLWCWHRSHHEPRRGTFERNDLFAVLFAVPAVALIAVGSNGGPEAAAWLGYGVMAYGAVYFLFHDGVVHRRFPFPRLGGRYLRRIVQAHHLHHSVYTREDGLSFGFLYAPPPKRLRARLRARRLI